MTTYEAAPLDAGEIVFGLRATLRKGLTRPLKWRLDQLHALVKLVEENEDDIYSALDSDLRRPKHDSFVMELSYVTRVCKYAIKNLQKWMAPEKVKFCFLFW